MNAMSISASAVAGLAIGIRMRSGASLESYGFCSSSSAICRPNFSTMDGPTRPVTRIITITALTTGSSNRPISRPTKVTASVAAAWGTERPNITMPSGLE